MKQLSVYLMAGPETPDLAAAAVEGGAGLLEIGFPFSDPLADGPVIRLAGERRDEIEAARARIRAGEARPAIVSALADPMISPSLDHLPFMLNGADVSVPLRALPLT